MRIWSLHPKYLDARSLVALWREALLANAVLGGQTCGYTHHPQLTRFRNSQSPMESIAFYLQAVHAEATRRGYCFDVTKIVSIGNVEPIVVTLGQIEYEWEHFKAKLRVRAPLWLARLESLTRPETHPLFRIIPGPMAEWEVTQLKKAHPQTRQKAKCL